MNGAQVHLLINHFPVIAPILAIPFCLWSFVKKDSRSLNAAAVLLVIGALSAILAFLSGDPAEDVVKNLPGISKPMIEEHEEAAEIGAIALGIIGCAALGFLVISSKGKETPFARGGLFAGAVVASLLMARAAHQGGMIHHQEIRPAGSEDPQGKIPNAPNAGQEDRD